MLRELPTNIKAAIFLAVILIVAAIGYGIYTAIDKSGKIPVTITAVPSDTKVTLNGKEVTPGNSNLKPGTYTIKGTKEGFSEYTHTQHIDQENASIYVLLRPASQQATQWATDNQSLYLEAEGKAGREANERGEAFRDKNPIVNVLPYSNLLYTIGYRTDRSDPSGDSIIIEIDAAKGYRNAAVEQIRSLGYDPSNFKINFRDYENPFAS